MFASRSILLAVLLAVFTVNACVGVQRVAVERDPNQWTSSAPLSIPYPVRLAHYQKRNLVPNPSFERHAPDDKGAAQDTTIAGWTFTDPMVERVDKSKAPHMADDVDSGRYAVKISRGNVGELDDAEGILSDYIPVIPGNYSFTYDVKIRNLSTGKGRLGFRLHDALTVRILFYDADKKPIRSVRFNPVSGTLLDNSNKSYSFANYWSIEDFPWATVRGRTYNYPYSEGDVPDVAYYVRLFFGLKGRGSVWLDNIEYRYSKWNFTALERMQPYIDKELAPEHRLIPTPKQVTRLADVTYWDVDRRKSGPPLILLPPDPAPAEQSAAILLKRTIDDSLKCLSNQDHPPEADIRITGDNFSVADIDNAELVFNFVRKGFHQIGADAYKRHSVLSADRMAQSYMMTTEHTSNATIVHLMGASPIGSYYAAATAVQLFDVAQGIFHNADVVDSPDFSGRSYTFRAWRTDADLQQDLDTIERMSLFKMNKVYAGNNRKGKEWYQPDPLFRRGVQMAGDICREKGFMSLALMVNPYSHLPFEASVDRLDSPMRSAWTHADPESLAKLIEAFEVGLSAGAETIMLHADDHVPHEGNNRKLYALYAPEDERRFVNLQNAHAHMINGLNQWVDEHHPGTRVEFCPPWYANEFIDRSQGRAEVYFKELTSQIPADVAIVWTGPTVRSLSIDMADLNRYYSLIQRWPMLWDNTLYARNIESKRYGGFTTHYPGKVRMCNIFEPFDTYRPKSFHRYNDRGHLFMNGDAFSEIYKIKFSTVADYEWNSSAYDPELSLWKILNRTYGPACAKELLLFNDAYYGLYDMCLRMEHMGVAEAELNEGGAFLRVLSYRLDRIRGMLGEMHPLPRELKALHDKQAARFRKLSPDLPLKNAHE